MEPAPKLSTHDDLEFLDRTHWSSRPRASGDIQHARRHSDFIRALRVVLPATVLLGLTLLMLWPALQPQERIALPPQMPQVTLAKPEYTGTNDNNQPYVIRADAAQQVAGRDHIIDLEKPSGEFHQTDTEWFHLRADAGRYDQQLRRLWLGGNIMIESHQGQSLDANELMVALDTHIAWSDKPVRFKGAFGVVEAAGMRLFNGGKFVQFTGPARAIIHPKENP